MNCFDWQNRVSDYLDGSLMAAVKREADEHLEKCEECSSHHKHFRQILSSVTAQPRSTLPVSLRKAPLAAAPPIGKIPFPERIRRWSELAWYVRVPLEGAGIVVLISVAISAGPKLRTFYERKIERSLTEYSEGFGGENAENAASTALGRGNLTGSEKQVGAPTGGATDDFAGSEGDSETDTSDTGDDDGDPQVVKATSSDTWRFNLKTDSPHDVRTKIVKILEDLKVPASTPGIGGIEAPGGIQFDLVVSQSIVPELKQQLEKIAPAAPTDLADSPFGETFTWYKKRSKSPVPAGQTHVVIWLAQI